MINQVAVAAAVIAKGIAEYVMLKIVDNDSNEFYFRIKLNTSVGKLKKSYACRRGEEASSLRFFFNGKLINDKDTAGTLNMKNDDVIMSKNAENSAEMIILKVVDDDSKEVHFRVNLNNSMIRLKKTYAERACVALTSLKFFFDGAPIQDKDTPKTLKMKEGDVIRCENTENKRGQSIFVKMVDEDLNEALFRLKLDTSVENMLKTYSDRRGVAVSSLRFLFGGKQISEEDTPQALGMMEDDVIKCEKVESKTDVPATNSQNIILRVVGEDSTEDHFRVKPNISMAKLMNNYAERRAISVSSLRFFFNEKQIKDEDTPKALELKQYDMIKVYQSKLTDPAINAQYILLKVIGEDSNEVHFRVKLNTSMRKIKKCYAERAAAEVSELRFLFNGKRINDDESPQTLEMTDNTAIKVYLEEHIGSM